MPRTKKVLFISGSFGLGHVGRDMAIAQELRKQVPDMELSWIAVPPASQLLADAGETLHPDSDRFADAGAVAEQAADGFSLNLVTYSMKGKAAWANNVEMFRRVTADNHYDLVVGDETYELSTAIKQDPRIKPAPFVIIYDFIGVEPMTKSPLERLITHIWNRRWSRDYDSASYPLDMNLFVGELEDIPDKRFGLMLPPLRDYARTRCKFLGYIPGFDPSECADRQKIRVKLGYGTNPLVVCSIGGTAIGRDLLELCGEAFPLIKRDLPSLRMILACGPRVAPDSLNVPLGVEARGYVPRLYEHFAACDLAIVLAGGTSTLELTALRRPFLFFPLAGHFEQQVHVAGRLRRHGAGVRMDFADTTPESLAEAVVANLGTDVDYPSIPLDGARKAAEYLSQLL